MIKYVLENIKRGFQESLEIVIRKAYPSFTGKIEIDYPKSKNLGDIATNIAFQIAYSAIRDREKAKETVNKFADEIVSELKYVTIPYLSEIKVVNGYINGYLRYDLFTRDVIKNILILREKYGSRERKSKKIIVEHTSANPIHPLHVGTARNSVLGDSIARIYRFIGYEVETRFYVNDVGKQVAYLVYAYSRIRDKVTISGKPDHWFGSLYSLANAIIEIAKSLEKIESLKNELIAKISKKNEYKHFKRDELSKLIFKLTKLKEYSTIDWVTTLRSIIRLIRNKKISEGLDKDITDDINQLYETLEIVSEWLRILNELILRWPILSSTVLHELINIHNIEERISSLMKKYERGNYTEVNNLFHEVCNLVLKGIKETLSKVDIKFDRFDWESELIWSGLVTDIINKLVDKGWVIEDEKGAKILDIREACKLDEIQRIFEIKEFKEDFLPPNLVLIRSDGTTLYTTRDIAYAILKGKDHAVEKVLNVIGKDQELPQKQLKAALYLAGYEDIARKIIHVSYELVILPGEKLSSRRGRYITFDELLDEATERAREEIIKRQRELSKEEEEYIARSIAVGAIKYALISVAPERTITFDWKRVINFEQNSGPFLQYSYARATSILRKINYNLPDPNEVKYDVLNTEIEKELIFNLARFPEIVLESSRKVRPDIIADYANKTAIIFNSFYQRYPVLKADTEDKKKARILLVKAFRTVLGNAMHLLGITPLEKM